MGGGICDYKNYSHKYKPQIFNKFHVPKKAEERNKELEEELTEVRSGAGVAGLPVESEVQPVGGFGRKSVFKSASKGKFHNNYIIFGN